VPGSAIRVEWGMMSDSPPETEKTNAPHDATLLLARIGAGDAAAADDLLPLVYEQLRELAQSYFRSQAAGHTLQPTAIVHEAYLKLVRGGGEWKNREHFCAVAATAMRQILIDHARAKRAARRGADRADVSFDQITTPSGSVIDLVALEDALSKLGRMDGRMARIVELRFFGGFTMEEIAGHLNLSRRTVQRDWRWIRAWLSRELGEGGAT